MVIQRLNHFLLKQMRACKDIFKKQGRSFSHIDSQNINFSRNFCFRALQKISKGRVRSSKVFRRSAYVRALQRIDSHGHTASQSFFIEANVSHWLFFQKSR